MQEIGNYAAAYSTAQTSVLELQKELSLSEWNTIEWNTLLLSGNGRTFAGANCSQSASATRWLPESPTDERIASGILTNQLTNPVDLSQSVFQSTLPVGGATYCPFPPYQCHAISIHAPRGGSDGYYRLIGGPHAISIHAPRGGSDCSTMPTSPSWATFQSTLPVGGATIEKGREVPVKQFQSTLPVGGATVWWMWSFVR